MKYLVGYSGGIDSQVALDLVIHRYENIEVFFIDTGLEFPETIDMINETEKYYDIEIRRINPPKTFEEYLISFHGFWPSPQRRWCTDRLKDRPIRKYVNAQKENVRLVDGVRKYESWRRMKREKLEWHKSGKWRIEHIVFHWRKERIFQYAYKNNLPINPLYALGFPRVSCWLCPFASQKTNDLVTKYHPKLAAKAQKWREQYGNDFIRHSKNL